MITKHHHLENNFVRNQRCLFPLKSFVSPCGFIYYGMVHSYLPVEKLNISLYLIKDEQYLCTLTLATLLHTAKPSYTQLMVLVAGISTERTC